MRPITFGLGGGGRCGGGDTLNNYADDEDGLTIKKISLHNSVYNGT